MFDLRKLRAIGAMAARQAREMASADPTAANAIIDMAPLLKPWKEGAWAHGEVCVHDGLPYRCMMAHDSMGNPAWSPACAAALWAVYHGTDAAHALPFKAEGHNPYKIGEWCTEGGEAYMCMEDATVWPPSVTPQRWKRA